MLQRDKAERGIVFVQNFSCSSLTNTAILKYTKKTEISIIE